MNSNIELSNLNSSPKFLSEYSVESVEGGEGRNGEMMMVLKGKEGRVRMKVNVKNGKKEGVGIMVRENNTVLMELCFENDEANVEVIVYDKMGKVMERGMLKNGMKNGVFVRYDKEGRVLREKYYKNGVGSGDSPKQVQRYISLTKLIPEMLQKLDDEIISFCPAVEIAALSEKEQRELLVAMEYAQAIPSLSQAQRIRQLSKEKQLSLEKMEEIMCEVKKGEITRVAFTNEQLHKYFPNSYTPAMMKREILALLKLWKKESWDS